MRLRPKLFALSATLVLVVAGCGDKAEYIDNAHGWFVGIDGGSSGPAVEAAGRFLRAPR
jgi:hypothetical protein